MDEIQVNIDRIQKAVLHTEDNSLFSVKVSLSLYTIPVMIYLNGSAESILLNFAYSDYLRKPNLETFKADSYEWSVDQDDGRLVSIRIFKSASDVDTVIVNLTKAIRENSHIQESNRKALDSTLKEYGDNLKRTLGSLLKAA